MDSKQPNIADGDLTIAKTAGLQTALDNAGGVKKPTMTIPEMSSGNILLNFTEPIKDLATYDKDDFVLTNEGTVIEPNSISVENNKVKFGFGAVSQDWTQDTSIQAVTGSTENWRDITSSSDGTKCWQPLMMLALCGPQVIVVRPGHKKHYLFL